MKEKSTNEFHSENPLIETNCLEPQVEILFNLIIGFRHQYLAIFYEYY